MQISVDSDRTGNGQPPQNLGAKGHTGYNEVSVLTNFVPMGFHCTSFKVTTMSYSKWQPGFSPFPAKLPCLLKIEIVNLATLCHLHML